MAVGEVMFASFVDSTVVESSAETVDVVKEGEEEGGAGKVEAIEAD